MEMHPERASISKERTFRSMSTPTVRASTKSEAPHPGSTAQHTVHRVVALGGRRMLPWDTCAGQHPTASTLAAQQPAPNVPQAGAQHAQQGPPAGWLLTVPDLPKVVDVRQPNALWPGGKGKSRGDASGLCLYSTTTHRAAHPSCFGPPSHPPRKLYLCHRDVVIVALPHLLSQVIQSVCAPAKRGQLCREGLEAGWAGCCIVDQQQSQMRQ